MESTLDFMNLSSWFRWQGPNMSPSRSRARGPTRPIREPYNIETILMEVLKLLEPEIQQRGIQINTDLQPSLPILSCFLKLSAHSPD